MAQVSADVWVVKISISVSSYI